MPRFRTFRPGATISRLIGDDSAIRLTSIGGNTSTSDFIFAGRTELDVRYRQGRFTSMRIFEQDQNALLLMPPQLDLRSFAGDVSVPARFTLFPSPQGDLNLLAAENVFFGVDNAQAIELILSDAQTDDAFTVALPSPSVQIGNGAIGDRFFELTARVPEFNSPTPLHTANSEPVRIVALNGDVAFASTDSGAALFSSAKPVRVSAGRDIVNFSVEAQNVADDSVTALTAGRDIIFESQRELDGRLRVNNAELTVAGPGLLQLRAGRDIDLQTSDGITTTGDNNNGFLPDGGATISLIAGLSDQAPEFSAFIERYIVDSDLYGDELIDFVNDFATTAVASRQEALEAFGELADPLREAFAEEVFFAELRASGREAAQPGELNDDFTRGFDALTTLFPGANPAVEDGEVNAYAGDVRLFFQQNLHARRWQHPATGTGRAD